MHQQEAERKQDGAGNNGKKWLVDGEMRQTHHQLCLDLLRLYDSECMRTKAAQHRAQKSTTKYADAKVKLKNAQINLKTVQAQLSAVQEQLGAQTLLAKTTKEHYEAQLEVERMAHRATQTKLATAVELLQKIVDAGVDLDVISTADTLGDRVQNLQEEYRLDDPANAATKEEEEEGDTRGGEFDAEQADKLTESATWVFLD